MFLFPTATSGYRHPLMKNNESIDPTEITKTYLGEDHDSFEAIGLS
jgi:hypothetical protein